MAPAVPARTVAGDYTLPYLLETTDRDLRAGGAGANYIHSGLLTNL